MSTEIELSKLVWVEDKFNKSMVELSSNSLWYFLKILFDFSNTITNQ